MQRTNIVLDNSLIGKAKRITGLKTIRELVDHAPRELVRHHRQRDILKLKGNINWKGNLSQLREWRKHD